MGRACNPAHATAASRTSTPGSRVGPLILTRGVIPCILTFFRFLLCVVRDNERLSVGFFATFLYGPCAQAGNEPLGEVPDSNRQRRAYIHTYAVALEGEDTIPCAMRTNDCCLGRCTWNALRYRTCCVRWTSTCTGSSQILGTVHNSAAYAAGMATDRNATRPALISTLVVSIQRKHRNRSDHSLSVRSWPSLRTRRVYKLISLLHSPNHLLALRFPR